MRQGLHKATRDEVLPLFEQYHGYKSLGKMLTYVFAYYEDDKPVAAYAWAPPAPGAAKSVCAECPQAVLALVRMVAVPKDQRKLKHVSKPLKVQMKRLIDRTRWPVLVTYADEGQGHTGYVYHMSGWTPTMRATRNVATDEQGARVSTYANGRKSNNTKTGTTTLQRFEHWACPKGKVNEWMGLAGWQRVSVEGKVWASGNPAFTYVKTALE